MTVDALLQGGPADGTELALIGVTGPPPYLLVMRSTSTEMAWIVCGVGFDDHWPGQLRYEKAGVGLARGPGDAFGLDCIVYRYAPQ